MATDAQSLANYFGRMDEEEEEGAKLAGVSPDEYRISGQPDTGPMAALRRVAAANTGPQLPNLDVPDPMELKPLTEADLQGARASYARRGSKLPEYLRVKDTEEPSAITPVPTAAGPSPSAEAPSSTVTKTMTAPPPPPAAPVAGAGGDADLDRLALGQSLIQGLETFGSAVSGKNLRSGMAESLGERYKQAQALQAKRAEKAEAEGKAARFGSRLSTLFPGLTPEQQKTLEQTIAEGGVEAGINVAKMFKGAQTDKEVQRQVNEAAITSAVARYPELATSFNALRPVAGEYPQKDFATMLDKAAAGQAGFAAKGAATRFMVDKQGRFNQLTPIEVEQERLNNDALRQKIDLNAREFTLKEKAALEVPGKTEQEFKEKLVTLGDKEKGFGGYVNLAKDLAEVEAAAPGFVTQGRPPEWLTTESLATAQKFPRSADPRVVRFLAKYANLANTKRHQLYGSAQTEGELRAFLQQLSDDPFFAGPEVIATQMQAFGESAARTATSTLNRYGKAFSPTSVATVFGDEFKPLYEKGGVFTGLGQKSPFAAAAPAAAPQTGGRPAKPEDVAGKKVLWNKKTGQWVRYTPEQEAKARAAGAIED